MIKSATKIAILVDQFKYHGHHENGKSTKLAPLQLALGLELACKGGDMWGFMI